MTDPLNRSSRSEMTRTEFIEFVRMIAEDRAGTEAEATRWVQHFDRLVAPHPDRNGLIFWPADGADSSPEGIAAEVERYCREHALPGFRAETA